jgi:hypothetical protein
MKKNGNGLLLDRILEPVSSSLNAEAARKILALKADRKTQARVSKLADKCNEGELTPDERREYEMYLMANHLIAILKAKARIRLARKGQPAFVPPRIAPLQRVKAETITDPAEIAAIDKAIKRLKQKSRKRQSNHKNDRSA